MSTQRFMVRTGKGSGHFILALLLGVVLVMQCLLPAGALARSTGLAVAFSSSAEQNYLRDKAGVSIVRLVATYDNGAANSLLTCTGLGVLVSSVRQGSTFQNQVLTDGNLVRTQLSTCGSPAGTLPLTSLEIWASNEYTNNASHPQLLGRLSCVQGRCKDTQEPATSAAEEMTTDLVSATTTSTTLFAFRSSTGEPFLSPDLLFIPTASSSRVVLTNGSGRQPGQVYPTSAVNGTEAPRNYLQPEFINPLQSAGSVPSGSGSANTIEGGTPILSGSGKLGGLFVTSAPGVTTLLNIPLSTLWQDKKVPVQQPARPAAQTCTDVAQTTACWNAGIDAFYGAPALSAPQYAQAESYFIPMVRANQHTVFQAPAHFESLARATTSSHGNAPPQGASSSSQALLIGVSALLVVLILLLVLVTLLMGRRRRHRRELAHFAAEQAEAQRQAEVEMQRIQAQLSRGREVACPQCHQPVRMSDAMCPHCRFPLAPTASGLHIRLMGNVPLPASPMSDQPTQHFPPAPVATAIGGAETTLYHQRAGQENQQRLSSRNLSLAVGTRSDPGIKRKHKPNEDSLFAIQGARTHNSQPQQFALFVVADGMGGHANGQDASRLAIQTMIDFMLPRVTANELMDDEAFLKLMGNGVQHANQAVHARNLEERADMGTTMTTALVAGSTAYVANVGDSRTYFYREGQGLSKVTHDHSVVASLVEAGIIQPDDIYTHPKRNQIYRSLGEKPVVEVDTFKVDLQAGDKLLLCTDGLWDMTRDPVIQQIMSKAVSDPNRTSQDLIRTALEGGGEDNVSVIVAQFSETGEGHGRTSVQLLAKPESVTVPDLPQS